MENTRENTDEKGNALKARIVLAQKEIIQFRNSLLEGPFYNYIFGTSYPMRDFPEFFEGGRMLFSYPSYQTCSFTPQNLDAAIIANCFFGGYNGEHVAGYLKKQNPNIIVLNFDENNGFYDHCRPKEYVDAYLEGSFRPTKELLEFLNADDLTTLLKNQDRKNLRERFPKFIWSS